MNDQIQMPSNYKTIQCKFYPKGFYSYIQANAIWGIIALSCMRNGKRGQKKSMWDKRRGLINFKDIVFLIYLKNKSPLPISKQSKAFKTSPI